MASNNLLSIINSRNGEVLGTLGWKSPGNFVWQPAKSKNSDQFPATRFGDWLHSLMNTCDNVGATVRLRPAPTHSGMDPLTGSDKSPFPRSRGEPTVIRRSQP